MHKLILLAGMALAPACAGVPFTITTEDVTAQFPGAPRVQSFSFGQWKGAWVFIGGRAAGYHSVGGGEAEFLRAQSNREVWVVDSNVTPARVYCASLDKLPESMMKVRDQLASTAQMSFQDGETLYIGGGYGQDHTGNWKTYPILSVIHLPTLIEGVKKGGIPPQSIRYVESPLVQSTGGEMQKLPDGHVYVVMGHNFNGSYTSFQGQGEQNRAAVSQVYLDEIRKLKIGTAADGSPAVTLVEAFKHEREFHRRDLNVIRYMSPEGMGIAIYGGVFTQDQLNWTKPIYLPSGGKPQVGAFEQKMNTYACATMLLYDSSNQAMYTTFFGGISRHYYDEGRFLPHAKVGTKSDAIYLDGMQWSDQISTIRKTATDTDEFVQAKTLPTFMGSDAVFIPARDVPRINGAAEIVDIAGMKTKRVMVGYIYGGIRASPYRFPYTRTSQAYNSGTVPTKPSDLVLKVYLDVQ